MLIIVFSRLGSIFFNEYSICAAGENHALVKMANPM